MNWPPKPGLPQFESDQRTSHKKNKPINKTQNKVEYALKRSVRYIKAIGGDYLKSINKSLITIPYKQWRTDIVIGLIGLIIYFHLMAEYGGEIIEASPAIAVSFAMWMALPPFETLLGANADWETKTGSLAPVVLSFSLMGLWIIHFSSAGATKVPVAWRQLGTAFLQAAFLFFILQIVLEMFCRLSSGKYFGVYLEDYPQ